MNKKQAARKGAEIQAAYQSGVEEGVASMFKRSCAAIMLACRDVYGFGQLRTLRLLERYYEINAELFSTQEAIERVMAETGITLVDDDALEPFDVTPKTRRKMNVTLERWPSDEDWKRCYHLALATAGKNRDIIPPESWRVRILKAEHSPIRTLMFTIRMEDVPTWVSTHFVRHHVGVEHYVKSQRNDRQTEYDRTQARQDAPITHTMDINAQALMNMARKRLCGKAADETRELMQLIVDEVVKVSPEFESLLVPMCAWAGACKEMAPCGRW